jgi:hypothetical protein
MPGKYRAVIIGRDGQVIEKMGFPLCSNDRGASDTVKSYAKLIHPKHAFVELWNGAVKVAKFDRDGKIVDFS